MNTDYDVIVVGAGPAGSGAAQYAAAGGAKVLLIERKERILANRLPGGEFMPDVEEMRAILPLADELDTIFDIPSEYILPGKWIYLEFIHKLVNFGIYPSKVIPPTAAFLIST